MYKRISVLRDVDRDSSSEHHCRYVFFWSPISCLINLSLVRFVSPNHMKLSASLSRLNGIPVLQHIKGLWLLFHLGEGKWVNSKVMHSKAQLHCAFDILYSKKSSVRRRCTEQLRTPRKKSGLSSPSFLHFWKCVGVSFWMLSVTHSLPHLKVVCLYVF